MILAIVLGMSCMASAYPWGLPEQVHDTPEVAAAKAAHLAAHAHAKQTVPAWGAQDRSWNGAGEEDDGSYKENDDEGSWKGSWTSGDDGSYKERPDSWNHESSVVHSDSHQKKWTGPVALPPGYDKNGAPLQVLDTPEVEAAKAKHFHLYHSAAHKAHDVGRWSHSH